MKRCACPATGISKCQNHITGKDWPQGFFFFLNRKLPKLLHSFHWPSFHSPFWADVFQGEAVHTPSLQKSKPVCLELELRAKVDILSARKKIKTI